MLNISFVLFCWLLPSIPPPQGLITWPLVVLRSLFDCHGHWRHVPAKFRPRRERNCRLFEAERCPTPRTRGICPKAAADAPKSNPGGPGILQFGANPTSHLRPPRLVGGDRPVIGKSHHTLIWLAPIWLTQTEIAQPTSNHPKTCGLSSSLVRICQSCGFQNLDSRSTRADSHFHLLWNAKDHLFTKTTRKAAHLSTELQCRSRYLLQRLNSLTVWAKYVSTVWIALNW